MGYTHYFYQHRDFTTDEWQELTRATRLAIANLPEKFETAECEYIERPVICGSEGEGEPLITGYKIWFNGDARYGLDHETMALDRLVEDALYESNGYTNRQADGSIFNFCKTARKPYDFLVCAVLLMAQEIAPGCLVVSSDGDIEGEDWQPAREFVRSLGFEARIVQKQFVVKEFDSHLDVVEEEEETGDGFDSLDDAKHHARVNFRGYEEIGGIWDSGRLVALVYNGDVFSLEEK